jgi:hypothetical protein
VTTRVDVDVCTAHVNTLAALLARRGDARTVTFGGDLDSHHSCAPAGLWTRTDRSAE